MAFVGKTIKIIWTKRIFPFAEIKNMEFFDDGEKGEYSFQQTVQIEE